MHLTEKQIKKIKDMYSRGFGVPFIHRSLGIEMHLIDDILFPGQIEAFEQKIVASLKPKSLVAGLSEKLSGQLREDPKQNQRQVTVSKELQSLSDKIYKFITPRNS